MGISSSWMRYKETNAHKATLDSAMPREEALHRAFAAGHSWGQAAAYRAGAGDSGLTAVDRLREALTGLLADGAHEDIRERLKDLFPPGA